MAAPTILRTQHKLGDYLFEPDLQKFNLPKKSSRPWIINNANEQNKLKDQFHPTKDVSETENGKNVINVTLNSSSRKAVPHTQEKISNTNYLENLNDNENGRTHLTNNQENNDNAKFSLNHKNSKSPKMKNKMNTKHIKNKSHQNQLNNLHNKNAIKSESQPQNKNKEIPANMNMDQDTEMDRIRAQSLQRDLELEYQNQINLMYNDPQYMEHYYQPLQYQPALHHAHSEHPLNGQILYHDPIFTQHVVQQPPMYFITVPLPIDEPSPMTPDTGSDYSSEDGSCYELNVSSDSSDDEVFDTNLQPEAFISNSTGAEEPDYEIPIEMDEELNMLVLSIIDD